MSIATLSANAGLFIGYDNDRAYERLLKADGALRIYSLSDPIAGVKDRSGNGGASGAFGSSVVQDGPLVASDYVDGSAKFPNSANSAYDANAIITFPLESALQFSGTSFTVEINHSVYSFSNFGGLEAYFFNLGDNTGLQVSYPTNNGAPKIYVNNVLRIQNTAGIGALNQPTHLAIAYDAAAQTVALYYNGIKYQTVSATPGTFSSSKGLSLGQSGTPNMPALGGSIGYVAIFGSVLTDAQILAHATAAGENTSVFAGGGGSVGRSLSASSRVAASFGSMSLAASANVNTVGDGIYMAALLADAPLRLFKLNDPDLVARDFSGNGGAPGAYGSSVTHDYSGAAQDYVSTAARFPAAAASTYDANSVITFPLDPALQFNGTSFTVEFIHNLSGTVANTSFFNLGDSTGIQVGYVPNNGAPRVSLGGTVYLQNSPTGVLNEPIHMAFTYDATTQTLTFYNNGVNRGSASVTPATFSSSMGLVLGQRGTAGSLSVDGSLQYVAIYNRALTPSQVVAHATAAGAGNGIFTGIGFGGSVLRLLNAAARIVTPVSIGAAAIVSAVVSASLGAGAKVVPPVSTQSLGAASYINANNDARYAGAVISDGPIRYYKLDEATGNSVAVDSSGNSGPSGTWGSTMLHEPSITPSDYTGGSALAPQSALSTYDANARVAFPYDPAAIPTGSFSVEYMAVYKQNTAGIGNGLTVHFVWQAASGIKAYTKYNDGRMSIDIGGVTCIANLTWATQNDNPTHVVIAYNALTQTLSVYGNGQFLTSTTVSQPAFSDATGAQIALDTVSGGPAFPGNIDNVAIYDYALTNAQALGHANAAGLNNTGLNGGSVPRSLSASANIVVPSRLGAAAIISAQEVQVLGASSRISSKIAQTLGATSRVSGKVAQSLGASAWLVQSGMITVGAGMHVFGNPVALIGAGASISQRVLQTLAASSRIAITSSASLGAGARVVQGGTLALNAGARVLGVGVNALLASATISSGVVSSIGGASMVESITNQAIDAAATILTGEEASLGADALISVTDTQTINAGAMVNGLVVQTLGAGASINALKTTFRVLEAAAMLLGIGRISLGAGAMVSLDTATQSLGAAMCILTPFAPILHANAIVDAIVTLSLGGGARVGHKTVSTRVREITVEPYYGDDA